MCNLNHSSSTSSVFFEHGQSVSLNTTVTEWSDTWSHSDRCTESKVGKSIIRTKFEPMSLSRREARLLLCTIIEDNQKTADRGQKMIMFVLVFRRRHGPCQMLINVSWLARSSGDRPNLLYLCSNFRRDPAHRILKIRYVEYTSIS